MFFFALSTLSWFIQPSIVGHLIWPTLFSPFDQGKLVKKSDCQKKVDQFWWPRFISQFDEEKLKNLVSLTNLIRKVDQNVEDVNIEHDNRMYFVIDWLNLTSSFVGLLVSWWCECKSMCSLVLSDVYFGVVWWMYKLFCH